MFTTAHTSMRGIQILRILILAILILGIIANPMDRSQAAPNNTLTVCSTGCDHTTIQAAVNAASPEDTIQILSPDPHTEGNILIIKNLTIQGVGDDASTIVQAAESLVNSNFRVFYIMSGVSVNIQNLTIRYGNFSQGGGIYNAGTLNLSNAVIEWNQNNGIYNAGLLTALDSIIRNNRAYGYGGGIFSELSAITTLVNTSVSNNTASPSGGGIYNLGTLNLDNSQIQWNKCEETGAEISKGGGIYNAGDLTILNSIIQGNQVLNPSSIDAYGGGLYSSNSTVEITNSVFDTNRGAEVDNSLLGGGLYIAGGEVEISGSTLTGHYQTAKGGGLYITDHALVDIINTTISDNTADSMGGGIYSENAQLNLFDTTISENTANERGGGMYFDDDTIDMMNSTISGNISNEDGGGAYIVDGAGQMTNSTVSSNYAEEDGGGLYLELLGADHLYLNNMTITRNRARTDNLGGDGGGLYNSLSSLRRVYLKNSILANNYRGYVLPTYYDDCNGTIYSQDYNLIRSETNCTILGDFANNLTGDPMLDVFGDYGGSTQTYMPLVSSPVIDAANPGGCKDSADVILITDQRGYARTVDGDAVGGAVCDIGAVEFALNPVPTLSSLDPASIQAGSADFSLVVYGSGFVDVAVVQWDGSDLPTMFFSSTQLIAQISAAQVAAVGSATVTVINPAPGGGVSNALEFSITPPGDGNKCYLPMVVR